MFLTLMALAVVVRVADLSDALAATLVFTAFVIGVVYPAAWQAAGRAGPIRLKPAQVTR